MKTACISIVSPDDLQQMSDSEIMQAVFDICDSGIGMIVSARIRRFRMNEDDMEDCITNIYIRLFDNSCSRIRKFRGESSFKTFICTVSDRILLDYIEKEMRVRDRTSGEELFLTAHPAAMDTRNMPERQFLEKEQTKAMQRCELLLTEAMKSLSPEEYSVLMLRFYQKKEYHEINDMMGIRNAAYLIKKSLTRIKYSLGSEGESIHQFIAEECL